MSISDMPVVRGEDGGECVSESDDWYGGTQRSTPICGECGFFRVDAQRTQAPSGMWCRMGWCAKRDERHDRCDLMPECQDGLLGNPKIPRNDVKERNRHRGKGGVKFHSRAVRCVTTGKIYPSITAAAMAYHMNKNTLSDAMLRSRQPKGRAERYGLVFEYLD